jgi:hypothetical protein
MLSNLSLFYALRINFLYLLLFFIGYLSTGHHFILPPLILITFIILTIIALFIVLIFIFLIEAVFILLFSKLYIKKNYFMNFICLNYHYYYHCPIRYYQCSLIDLYRF